MPTLRARFTDIERWSPLLVRMSLACAALCAVALVGLVVDSRTITGAPAWLKPAKFGASVAIYLITLAWMVRDLPRTRPLRVATSVIACLLVLEVCAIDVQAARGTTSHFNVNTTFDMVLFSGMGIGIATVWVMSAVLLWLHLRAPAADRAMALALRIGLALNIAGAGVGWAMTQPRPDQLAAIHRGERPFVVGSHTIGAPDGGPGLPVTYWSVSHGDLRVPHFVGMHALQLLPLLLLGLRRARQASDDGIERGAILFAGAVSALAFVAVLVQALHGNPLIPIASG